MIARVVQLRRFCQLLNDLHVLKHIDSTPTLLQTPSDAMMPRAEE